MLYNPDDKTSLACATSVKGGKAGKNKSARKWKLLHKLYLNPVNDLCRTPAAAYDLMEQPETMPSSLRMTPQAFRFLLQIRLEYIAARQLACDSIHAKAVRKVKKNGLANTENEPLAYSLAMESLKLAYRSAYSLLPKIAQVIRLYFRLKPDHGQNRPQKRLVPGRQSCQRACQCFHPFGQLAVALPLLAVERIAVRTPCCLPSMPTATA